MNTSKPDYRELEKSFPRKHKIGWTPKFKKVLDCPYKENVAIELSLKVFEKLNWDYDRLCIETIYQVRKLHKP